MNCSAALSAAALEQEPAKDGDVVPIGDRLTASATVRSGSRHRLVQGEPRNANVQEAAEGQARESEEDGRNHHRWEHKIGSESIRLRESSA
jgi:hypothetical protein